jgi:hypothetical protein
MTVEFLDRASQIRSKTDPNVCTTTSTTPTITMNNNTPSSSSSSSLTNSETQAEASYLFAASNSTVPSSFSQLNQRTGRWTDEETDFVDFLVHAFDRGSLPMAAGIRLNDFLCSVLMCKASRLTKKMKNARLSMRVYEIRPEAGPMDCEMMTTMQEKFLHSIEDEATRLEIRFVMDKAWRQNVYNLCLQVGYPNLDASAWMECLDGMESRAAQAEENIRKARRARMGLVTTTTTTALPDNHPHAGTRSPPIVRNSIISTSIQTKDRQDSFASTTKAMERAHISNNANHGHFKSNSFDDFTNIFHCLERESTETINVRKAAKLRNSSGSFLDEVLTYIQTHNLPFQHVDVWVPSHRPDQQQESKFNWEDFGECLLHSGHATRCDLDPTLFRQFHEFGDYSANFTFLPGVGLPGRVFKSGKPSWECRLDQSDANHFQRSNGAKTHGIKTRLGIPLSTESYGRIVTILYSIQDVSEDPRKVEKWMSDFSAIGPRPKWKLVVESGSQTVAPKVAGSFMSDEEYNNKPMYEQASVYSTFGSPDSTTSQISARKKRSTSQDNLCMEIISRSVSSASVSTRDLSNLESDQDQEIAMATLLGRYAPKRNVASALPSHSLVGLFSSTGSVLPCITPVFSEASHHSHILNDVYGEHKKRRLLDDLTDAINIVDENEPSGIMF